VKNNMLIRDAVRQALGIGALATAAGYLPLAHAQRTDPVEEVVVTGTRIIRQDYESASPIVSVTNEEFLQSGTINAEDFLNRLPQVAPHLASGNNNPGTGQSHVDLRGLAPERTIVLVDAKRLMPSNEDGQVDINAIPTAMIERVEILTGGASAVYGSDAIAGAVNFILRDDFEGVEISAQTGESFESDTASVNAEILVGSSLADDRGHVMLWATRNQRDLLSKGDRAFSRQAVSGTSYFPTGNVRRAAGNPWTLASVQNVFTNMYGATPPPSETSSLVGNDDTTLFTQGNSGEGIHNFREVLGEDINGLYVAQNFLPDDAYSYNFEPFNNLIIPQERLNFGTSFKFDVSDNVELYSRLMFTNYTSDTRLAPSPAPTGENSTMPGTGLVEFTVPVTNPFVQQNAGLMQILNSRTGDNAVLNGTGANEDFIFRYRFLANGPRIEAYDRDVYQWIGGARGQFSDKWRFDGYYAQGKYSEQLDQNGNVSVRAVETLLDAPDGGASLCDGGFNPIGVQMSPDCADFVGVLAKNTQNIEHNHAEFIVTGDIFDLPGGTASIAIGTFWQQIAYEKKADEILASGDVSGFNAEDNIFGRTRNADLFAELYLPITDKFGITTGFRNSDHNIAGSNNSYKFEADYRVADPFRLRASYQRAVRAPNIGELFEPRVEDNPEVEDPCNFDSAFRTGPNAAQVSALCLAQGILASELPTFQQSNDQIDALQGGNPNLFEETGDTYTVGFVWEPEAAESIQLSVDYFNIEIEDVITFLDPNLVLNQCFNADGTNPTYSNTNVQCAKFGRSPGTGDINDLLELQENIGGLRADGVDVQFDWTGMIGDVHELGFNVRASRMFENAEQPAIGQNFIDYVGSIGENEGEVRPDMTVQWTTLWGFKNFQSALGVRYIPDMIHEAAVLAGSTDEAVCGCTGVGSTVYVDASTRWQPTDAFTLRLGIDNLTDRDPKLYTPDQDSGTNPSVFDVVGRRYYLTATYRF
jgi:iron complex outermembrane recepter protein